MIKSRGLRWAGHVACVGDRTGANRVLVEKPEGTRPLGGPRCRWKNNIKVDAGESIWVRIETCGWVL